MAYRTFFIRTERGREQKSEQVSEHDERLLKEADDPAILFNWERLITLARKAEGEYAQRYLSDLHASRYDF